jgi:hypothetical protein
MTSGANFLLDSALTNLADDLFNGQGVAAREYKTRKHMNYWTLGLSFLVNL